MSDVEFLPAWYSRLWRKRRLVALQAWLLAIIVVGLGLWTILAAHIAQARQTILDTRNRQLMQSSLTLEKLAQLRSVKAGLSGQAQLVDYIGLQVPVGLLLDELQTMMPRDMALLDIRFDLEQPRTVSASDLAAGSAPPSNHQLSVKIHGVAPSDVEVGNLLTRLASIPHFRVTSMATQDLRREGHLMRDFTVSFTVDLSNPDQ